MCDRYQRKLEDGDVVKFPHHGKMMYGQVWGMHRENCVKGECTLIIEYHDEKPLKKICIYQNTEVEKVSLEKALLYKLENA